MNRFILSLLIALLLLPSVSVSATANSMRAMDDTWIPFDSGDVKREKPCYYDPYSVKYKIGKSSKHGSKQTVINVDVRMNDRKNSTGNKRKYTFFLTDQTYFVTHSPNYMNRISLKPIDSDPMAKSLFEKIITTKETQNIKHTYH